MLKPPTVVVPRAGIEPAQPLGPRDFKSLASTNSATQAWLYLVYIIEPKLCQVFRCVRELKFGGASLRVLGACPTIRAYKNLGR